MDWATLFTGLQTDAEAAITAVAPYALGIGASVIALRLGFRLFRGFAK